jgi:acetoin utilization deacetylase AcuC-like enzyme
LYKVAIAARAAPRLGAGRIAIFDWDVHHGNGTQHAFEHDPSVLFISVHQDGLFPLRSGAITETGEGAGAGTTINVPLPPGSGHGAYLAVVEQIVAPAFRAFRPDLILVSAGQDSGFHDPMGRMMCHTGTYRAMTRTMMALAAELCSGRLVITHEGGYSPWDVPFLVEAIVTEMAGLPEPPPVSTWAEQLPGQDLQPHQAAVIARVLATHRPYGLAGK